MKVFERFTNSCDTFLDHPYFWDYRGMMVALPNQLREYDGLLVSDNAKACPNVITDTRINLLDNEYWAPTLSFVRKASDPQGRYKRFCALPIITNSDPIDWDAKNLYETIKIPDSVKIPFIVSYSLNDKDLESIEISDFFDSILPYVTSSI